MENQFIVKEIFIYPVKGLRGISVSSSKVTELGLANDRVYMIADQQGQLISQRTHTELALMQVKRIENSWTINYQDEVLTITDETISADKMNVEVWDMVFSCHEVSKTASSWFTRQLGLSCKLMMMPNKKTRLKVFSKPPFETFLSFADGYPINILGTKSMENLNQKLDEPIKANRFRSNIIIETNTPHEEDLWGDYMIGDVVRLRNIKPCVRCEVIAIDQELGKKGKEPLTTLATYRRQDNGVCFASNAITLLDGEIKVGDSINIIDQDQQ